MYLVGSVKSSQKQLPNFRGLTQQRLVSHSCNTSVQVFDGDLRTLAPSICDFIIPQGLIILSQISASSWKQEEKRMWRIMLEHLWARPGDGEYHSHFPLHQPRLGQPVIYNRRQEGTYRATSSPVGKLNILDEELANFFLPWAIPQEIKYPFYRSHTRKCIHLLPQGANLKTCLVLVPSQKSKIYKLCIVLGSSSQSNDIPTNMIHYPPLANTQS